MISSFANQLFSEFRHNYEHSWIHSLYTKTQKPVWSAQLTRVTNLKTDIILEALQALDLGKRYKLTQFRILISANVVIGSQVDHIALNVSLTNARKVKWLRERMIGSSAETLLMNHIKEFILHDEPIDVERLRKCLHRQVCDASNTTDRV